VDSAVRDHVATWSICLLAVAGGCVPAGVRPSPSRVAEMRQFIESEREKSISAIIRGDAVAMASNYADDAVLVLPNEPAIRGREAIIETFAHGNALRSVTSYKATIDDLTLRDDLAVETGSFDYTMKSNGAAAGAEIHGSANYVKVWQKQSTGSWKVVRAISSSILPAGPSRPLPSAERK
jgi:ketosteroid isomerase-like protein